MEIPAVGFNFLPLGLSGTPVATVSPTSPWGLSHHTQAQGTGSRLPSPAPTEGLLWGTPSANSKLSGQRVSKVALLWRPRSNRWEDDELLTQQAWGKRGDRNCSPTKFPGDAEAAGVEITCEEPPRS